MYGSPAASDVRPSGLSGDGRRPDNLGTMSESTSTPPKQGHKRKILATFATLALMSSVGVVVTSAAFTATTDNTGNRIEAGSVALSDSDAATGHLYDAPDQVPGAANGPAPHCLRVTYSGSLASAVKLYSTAIANGANFRLKVERGSGLSAPGSDMNCTGFSPSSTAYDDTLNNFPTTYATGLDGKPAAAAWTTGNTVDYRYTIYTVDDTTPNAHTTKFDSGTHTFTWEARNN